MASAAGRNGVKRLGIGCAKLAMNPSHEGVLATALEYGIRSIDTAPNYGHDYSSERVIGHVLRNQKMVPREDIHVSTKFGYHLVAPEKKPVQDSVEVGGGLHFSISPEVMQQEVQGSLTRLKQDYVDMLYIHNPEHYLVDILVKHEHLGKGEAFTKTLVEEETSKLKERLIDTFEALEGVVAEGSIRSYGVSSNGLALPPQASSHLSLDVVLEAAAEGAKRAGRVVPSLGAIQIPINLLEPEGLAVAKKARARGLDVVANRALTGVANGCLYRLVDLAATGKPPEGYMEACREALEYFNPVNPVGKEEKDMSEEERETREGCRIVQDLIRDMNKSLLQFTSMTLYETELERRIIPLISSTFESVDEEAADRLQAFFAKYGEMVRYNAATKVRELVQGPACPSGAHVLEEGQALHEYALQWLLKKVPDQVSTVLVGMPREDYVRDVVRIATGASADVRSPTSGLATGAS